MYISPSRILKFTEEFSGTFEHCHYFKRNKSLQNFKWTLSIISFLSNPQISHPYNKTDFAILSNKSSWHLIDKLCILPFLNTSYMALIPLFTSSFFAILNDPVFESTIPR